MPKTTPRAVVGARVAGLLVGIAAAVTIILVAPLGLGVLLGPSLVAGGLLLGTAVAEVVVRRPPWDGETGPSGVRALVAAVPRNLTIATVAGILVIAGTLAATTATAASDAHDGGSRTLQTTCSAGQVATATPWPGSYYSVPLAVVIACGVVVAALALVLVVRRPRGGTVADEAEGGVEDGVAQLRKQSARPLVEGLAGLTGLALGSITLATGTALVNISCGSVVQRIVGWFLLVVAIAAMLAGLRYVARLALGSANRQPRHSAR